MDAITKREFFTVNRLAAPIMVTSMVNYLISVGVQIIVGHLGASELAAAALGTMYANAFGNSFALGLSNAVDVLSAQAFGAKNLRRMGSIASRGLAINLLFCIPIGILWWCAESVLTALNQPEEVIHRASIYLRFMLIGLPGNMCYEIIRRTLVVIGLAPLPLMISIISACTSTLTGYILVYHTSLGFVGAPIAISVSQWLQFLIGAILVRQYRFIFSRIPVRFLRLIWATNKNFMDLLPEDKHPNSGGTTDPVSEDSDTAKLSLDADSVAVDAITIPLDDAATSDPGTVDDEAPAQAESPSQVVQEMETSDSIPDAYMTPILLHIFSEILAGVSLQNAFQGWYEYLFLGFPSAVMLLVEWGAYETTSIIAGLLGTEPLATHSIIATTVSISYMVPLGYGIAIGIRLGQCMGNRDVATAKLVYRVGLYCVLAFSVINGGFIMIVKDSWPRLFTHVESVTRMTSKLMWLCALYTGFDTLQCICSAVLRAMGKPAQAAVANMIGYLGVGLVLAYILGIKTSLGLRGIWLAFLAAVIVSLTIMMVVILRTDWNKAAEKAYEKARIDGDSVEDKDVPPVFSACGDVSLPVDSVASHSHKAPLAQKDASAAVQLEMIEVVDTGILPVSPLHKSDNRTLAGGDIGTHGNEHGHEPNQVQRPMITTSTTDHMQAIPSQFVPSSDPANVNGFPIYTTEVPEEAVPEVAVQEVAVSELNSSEDAITNQAEDAVPDEVGLPNSVLMTEKDTDRQPNPIEAEVVHAVDAPNVEESPAPTPHQA